MITAGNSAMTLPRVYNTVRCMSASSPIRLLEVATPTAPPLSGRGYHAQTWRSHGHSIAAYL